MNTNRLPPGRHGLSRQLVADSQRERILRAMAQAAAEHGYANVSVAEVLKRAGVSRETFYEQFSNKEACFLAVYDEAVAVIMKELREALPPPPWASHDGPLERLGRFFESYLDALESEPALARAALIESYAAGPVSILRRAEGQARGAEAIAAMVGAKDERQRFACTALVAMIVGLATQRIASGQGEQLQDLHAPLMDFARSSLRAVGIE
ncbi:MAG TPA: TetR/AcrR family transcriptional regulator [Solirubrobacteraceae bacterium]